MFVFWIFCRFVCWSFLYDFLKRRGKLHFPGPNGTLVLFNSFSRIFAFNKYFFISSAVEIIRAWWRQPQPRHSQQAQGRDAEPARDQAVYRANRQVPAPGRRQRHRPADWRAGAVMGKWLDWRLHHHARTCSCAGSCSWREPSCCIQPISQLPHQCGPEKKKNSWPLNLGQAYWGPAFMFWTWSTYVKGIV